VADHHDETVQAAHRVADALEERGHTPQAGELRAVLVHNHAEAMLLSALRHVCQLVLTSIEAIDPVCGTLVEELRLEVDKRLEEGHPTSG
jgi:hypothetical protein